MKYISISPGINIKKESIDIVEDINGISCKVVTSSGAYESIYPAWRILMLLEQPDIEEQMAITPQTPDRVNLWGSQHFAG